MVIQLDATHTTSVPVELEFAPGLVLYKNEMRRPRRKKWGIYHERSGLALGFCERKRDALEFGKLFALLADWAQELDKLKLTEEIKELVGRMQSLP